MRRRHCIHVVDFAVGRFVAMEFSYVPRRRAFLPEGPFVADGNIAFTENDIGTEVVGRVFFDARYRIRYGLNVGGYVGTRAVVLVVAPAAGAARDRQSTRLNSSH